MSIYIYICTFYVSSNMYIHIMCNHIYIHVLRVCLVLVLTSSIWQAVSAAKTTQIIINSQHCWSVCSLTMSPPKIIHGRTPSTYFGFDMFDEILYLILLMLQKSGDHHLRFGSLSHYFLKGLYTSQRVQDFSHQQFHFHDIFFDNF